ncbi:MAG: DNA repair exonuclease [Clostridia bacterium]|nr:DNA repair exonuclease [Clostridia bacterium]
MNTVKILHCADLHIGAAESSLGTLANSRRAEALITFENIISIAKGEGTKLLLIAGDLFDSNNIEDAFVSRVIECFNSIPETEIIYAAGNHDPLTLNSPFIKFKSILPKNFHILPCFDSVVELENLGVKVYGRSFDEVYVSGAPSFSITPDDDFINIMCIHGDFGASTDTKYNPISSSFIESSGMDYMALGHIHKRSDIARLGSTYFAYPGCPEGQGFDESGEKGVLLGEIGKGLADLRFIPTCKRIHATVSITLGSEENSNQVAERILSVIKEKYKDNWRDNLYKIILEGRLSENIKLSTEEIASRVGVEVYFAKVKDKTEIAVDLEELSREDSLKGIFVKNMLSRLQNASEEEKPLIKKALDLGLKAFLSEVKYNED